jgi:hypothetical protein
MREDVTLQFVKEVTNWTSRFELCEGSKANQACSIPLRRKVMKVYTSITKPLGRRSQIVMKKDFPTAKAETLATYD